MRKAPRTLAVLTPSRSATPRTVSTLFKPPGIESSRDGEALKIAEKFQGGGHANAAGATMPKTVRNIPDALIYIRKILNPQPVRQGALNSLESAFAALDSKAPGVS